MTDNEKLVWAAVFAAALPNTGRYAALNAHEAVMCLRRATAPDDEWMPETVAEMLEEMRRDA